jgi:hypothetical protein
MKQVLARLIIIVFLFGLAYSQPFKINSATLSNENYILDIHPQGNYTSIVSPTPIPQKTPMSKNTVEAFGYGGISWETDFIDFGILTPTDPSIRTVGLILTGSPFLPFVLVEQTEKPFSNQDNILIPPTSCDEICSARNASVWRANLTFGAGIRCENRQGNFCRSDFLLDDFYSPTAATTNLTMEANLGAGVLGSKQASVMLRYKLNVPATQPSGDYRAQLRYLFIPNL